MATKKEEVLERDFTLNEKLAIIQTEFKSKKSRFNSFGKYNFRSAEDILEATKPFLLRLGVSVTVNEIFHTGDPFPIIRTTAEISDGTNAIRATAIVGVDLDQKGMQMPQKFGSASSYGKKYALGNLFLIDDTQDADHGTATPSPTTKQKVKITLESDTFEKAKAYVKDQASLNTILDKYDVDPKAIEVLKTMI
jgi:hypothetical protein